MLSQAATMQSVRRRSYWMVAGLVAFLITIVFFTTVVDLRPSGLISWGFVPLTAALVWLFAIPFVRRRPIRALRRELRRARPEALIVAAEVSNSDDAGFIGILAPEREGLRVHWLGDEAGELLPWAEIEELKYVRFGEILRLSFSGGDRLWIRVLGPAAVAPSSFASLHLVRTIEQARQAARRALEPY